MKHDLGIRIGGALLVAVLMAASSLLMAAPALAQTKKAYLWAQVDNACCNAGGTYTGFFPAFGSATVGSTPSTPSVMIRSGLLSRVSTYTWTGPLTPFSVNYIDAHNAAVTFNRQHSLAPTATTTVRAGDKTSTAVGGDFYFPRYGTMMQKPGTHRFGGTMGIVSDLYAYGKYAASVGYYSFYGSVNPTSMLHGPVSVGQYGFLQTGMFTHSTLQYKGEPLAFDGPAIQTLMPSTTGTQYLYQPFGYYVTQYTWAGYDNRTASGLFGTLSLVSPNVLQYFWVTVAPPQYVAVSETQGFMSRITLTFLPEPGSLLTLGCGILTLAGLFRLRMR